MDKPEIYDKPFKTIEEQIAILQSRNITILDFQFAKATLKSLSYYTVVNGYKNSFLSISGTDSFKEGTKFEELYTLHLLDTSLSSLIFKNILYIERYLKTRISYLISDKYGVYTDFDDILNSNRNDYLCRDYYSRSNGRRENILLKIKQSIVSNRRNTIVDHYLDTKNHMPPWITVTNIPFGLAIEWYIILVDDDKSNICEQFILSQTLAMDSKKEFLKKALSLLKEYRNNTAHGNRTFNAYTKSVLPQKQLIELSNGMLSKSEYNLKTGQNDLFAVIMAIIILIDDKYILKNLYNDLVYTFAPYENAFVSGKTILETFNLPNDLFERLEKYLNTNKFCT